MEQHLDWSPERWNQSHVHISSALHILGVGSWGEEALRVIGRSDIFVSAGIAQYHGQAKNPETSFTWAKSILKLLKAT